MIKENLDTFDIIALNAFIRTVGISWGSSHSLTSSKGSHEAIIPKQKLSTPNDGVDLKSFSGIFLKL